MLKFTLSTFSIVYLNIKYRLAFNTWVIPSEINHIFINKIVTEFTEYFWTSSGMGVDWWGRAPSLQPEGDSIGNVPHLFSSKKINLPAQRETDHAPLLKASTYTTSIKINKLNIKFQLPSAKPLDKLLGWPQCAT